MNVLYLTSTVFPTGAAYSGRIQGFSSVFRDRGARVHVMSDYTLTHEPRVWHEFEEGTFEAAFGPPNFYARLMCMLFGPRRLRQFLLNHHIDVVIVGNTFDRFARLLKTCRKMRVPIILEVCEWYDTSTWRMGAANPYAWLYRRAMRKSYLGADGAIAISSLLQEYFSDKGLPAIRIPTILKVGDFSSEATLPTPSGPINLVHVGFSGVHKEKYGLVLEGLLRLPKDEIARFVYNIYGASREEVLANLGNKASLLSSGVKCKIHGRVPQPEVPRILRSADYSIFLRPEKMSNDAGFPTKLAESMAAGLPVITNRTGDIERYLQNGTNGFLLDHADPGELSRILHDVLLLDDRARRMQRDAARATALANFDVGAQGNEVWEFVRLVAGQN